ncbi:hypothetical protein Tco_0922122 [Tanacetum coccineum]|uniref:Xylulose kinase-1 n=1 Tax=Tanacetum coccineum TaxID=301880 RepID=A0ABQ5CY89_9ASTR
MADLEFVDQHNMVACLEKTRGNSKFHEIVDFLTSSLIDHALTVSPTIYISYIEQFWNTASSQTVSDEKQIHATVDSKAVVVTEASIRISLLLNDADGTACLTNEAIFQNLALMGFQGCSGFKLKTRIKKLKKKSHLVISHHKAWLRSVSRLSMKRKLGRKESVSKQGRKHAKPRPTLDAFDDLDADLAHGMEYMDTEEALNRKGGSTVSTVRPERVSTGGVTVNTVDPEISVVEPRTPPTTASIFDDDVTMAQTLINMKEEKAKEKRVAFKDVEDFSRPARSILTLKPLPIIDPKDKGKGVLQEPAPAKKMAKSDFDVSDCLEICEFARQLEVDWQAEEERKRQREEEASKAAIAEMYNEVQAGIDADALFVVKLQQEEREEYTIEEREKFLAVKTIVLKEN